MSSILEKEENNMKNKTTEKSQVQPVELRDDILDTVSGGTSSPKTIAEANELDDDIIKDEIMLIIPIV